MTTDRRRALLLAVGLGSLLALLAERGGAAPAWPRYAERERLSCSACHLGSEGGPLTALGRQYRWRVTALDLEDPAGHARSGEESGGGARSGPGARSRTGRWSGEATVWARSGGSRVLGERTRSFTLAESLRLDGEELFGDERISFSGEGYARSGFADETGGFDDDGADVASAAVTWRSATNGAFTRLGRQYVASGAIARRIDGLEVRAPVGRSLDLDLFGGVPSDRGFGGASGDLIAGGRLGSRLGSRLGIGASGFYAKDEADPSDVKGGIDLHWSPLRRLDLSGHLFYDWIAERIYDARAHAVWMPSIEWQLALDWTHAVPGLFLPKNSIFSVFSVDAYEETGLSLTRRFDERLSTRAFVRYTAYDDGGDLVHFGGGVDRRYGPNGEDSVGAEIAYQDEGRDDLGGSSIDSDALFVRGYHLLWWTAAIYTALDASAQLGMSDAYERDATLARVVVGYDPHGAWDVECGVDWVRDPDYEDRLDLFARLRVRF